MREIIISYLSLLRWRTILLGKPLRWPWVDRVTTFTPDEARGISVINGRVESLGSMFPSVQIRFNQELPVELN